MPSRVWWRSLCLLLCLSLLIGFISILAFSDIQTLDSNLRNPSELQIAVKSYKEWYILQIPSQKIWFINLGPYNLSRKAFELGIWSSHHDLLGEESGHLEDSEVVTLDLRLHIRDNKTTIDSFTLLSIQNLSKNLTGIPGDAGLSWRFQGGFKRKNYFVWIVQFLIKWWFREIS